MPPNSHTNLFYQMSTNVQNEKQLYNNQLESFLKEEKAASKLLTAHNELLYEKQVELVLYRNPMLDVSVPEILRLHNYARKVVQKPLDVFCTSELAHELLQLDLAPAKIDIGKLGTEWLLEAQNYVTKAEFVADKMKSYMASSSGQTIEPKDVVLFGFGRIGRLAARELVKQAGKGQQLRLKAIVTRGTGDEIEIQKRASLLRNDSVHGHFDGTIIEDYDNKALIINGQRVKLINANNPEDIDYTVYGIENALLIDNTGAFRDRTALSRHLKSKGISKVILTAPGKEVPNIVYAVNHKTVNVDEENIFSAASCTTNAIVPILKVVNDSFGIEKGHIETVHSYTNDQNLLDNWHKKYRRGRSAAVNMVITETGAGKAVTKVIPEFQDKLTANAVRVPTPNGSLAIMNLTLSKNTTIEEVNNAVRKAALEGVLVNQIYYSVNDELVSSDIIGNTCCSVYDSKATLASTDGSSVVLYVWYDNEFGYTKQVIRLAKHVSKVARLLYY